MFHGGGSMVPLNQLSKGVLDKLWVGQGVGTVVQGGA